MAEEQNVAEMQEAAEAQASIDAQSDSLSSEPSPKRKVKRGWIVAGVVAAVIVVAGVGFWVWHETPGFCNSVCHSPMDSYVESYYSGDKGMLVTAHADADENCLSCHEPVMTEQVGEAMKWVSDDYPMTPDGTKLATGKDFASEEFCAKSGCHNMDEVVAKTWGFEGNDEKFNPHSSHQDLALECGDCHKAHETSVLVCEECHALNMPEGWEAPNEK